MKIFKIGFGILCWIIVAAIMAICLVILSPFLIITLVVMYLGPLLKRGWAHTEEFLEDRMREAFFYFEKRENEKFRNPDKNQQ